MELDEELSSIKPFAVDTIIFTVKCTIDNSISIELTNYLETIINNTVTDMIRILHPDLSTCINGNTTR